MRKRTEKGDFVWDFYDQTFCTAESSPIAESSQSRCLGLDEVMQSYVQGAELIVQDINVLKSLLWELRCDEGIHGDDDDYAEIEEQIEEALECLVRAEEAIRDSEQIVCDLTFPGYEAGDAYREPPLPRGFEDE